MARAQQPTSARKTDGGNAAPPVSSLGSPRPADVATRAYELWQKNGRPHGKDQEHWFQAEQELRGRKTLR
ncbi:MAG TPA: DUF2934 domain-containing protein [Anaeromyxobacter sp.]